MGSQSQHIIDRAQVSSPTLFALVNDLFTCLHVDVSPFYLKNGRDYKNFATLSGRLIVGLNLTKGMHLYIYVHT